MNGSTDFWPADKIVKLRALWVQTSPKLSASQIGREIGCSKNAVIGKARRIGLSARPVAVVIPPHDYGVDNVSLARQLLRDRFSVDAVQDRTGLSRYKVRLLRAEVFGAKPADKVGMNVQTENWIKAPKVKLPRVFKQIVDAVKASVSRPGDGPQCQWLEGNKKPWTQCDNPAITSHEGTVWCAECRRKVYIAGTGTQRFAA